MIYALESPWIVLFLTCTPWMHMFSGVGEIQRLIAGYRHALYCKVQENRKPPDPG
jgi:hypothetical protein